VHVFTLGTYSVCNGETPIGHAEFRRLLMEKAAGCRLPLSHSHRFLSLEQCVALQTSRRVSSLHGMD
jgi:hypothetical protein